MSIVRSHSTSFNDVPFPFAIIAKFLVAGLYNMSKLLAIVAPSF